MGLPENPPPSRDVALAALSEALVNVGQADERLTRADGRAIGLEQGAARQSSPQQTGTAVLRTRSSLGALVLWSLIGPLAVAGIGAAAFTWPSPQGLAVRLTIARWVQEGLSTPSSVWLERLERLARTAPSDLDVIGAGRQQPSSEGQTPPPQIVAPITAPMSPQLTMRLQTITRELAEVQQAIEQLRASQAQFVHDNAGLAERVKETQEQMARQTDELANDLKQTRSEIGRGSADTAAQLKASQEQMAGISQQLKGSTGTNDSPWSNRAAAVDWHLKA